MTTPAIRPGTATSTSPLSARIPAKGNTVNKKLEEGIERPTREQCIAEAGYVLAMALRALAEEKQAA